jgi:hypothetical protein
MSAHQMVCHLADGCRMALGQKRVKEATGLLRPTIMKWGALYLPLSWPPGILTTPELDQQCDGTKPGEFAADLAELESLIELMSARREIVEWPAHPIFGRMSQAAWFRWAYLHTDHHLRQFGA